MGFDPERYLRRLGERWLLGLVEESGFSSPLVEAARALVVMEDLGEELAETIIEDYHRARELRQPDGPQAHRRLRRGPVGAPAKSRFEPARVYRCEAELTRPEGTLTVHWVALDQDSTRIGITMVLKNRRGRNLMGGPRNFRLLAEGMRAPVDATFAGGGDAGGFHGHLHASYPLPADTPWIEIDGGLVDLVDSAAAPRVWVEALPERDRAFAYLWQILAEPGHRHHRDDGLVVPFEVLRTAGHLPDDDDHPEVAGLLWAAGARLAGRVLRGAQIPGGKAPVRVPDEWRTLTQGVSDGLEGVYPLAVVTPEFDGYRVRLDALECRPDEVHLALEMSPGVSYGPFESSLQVGLAFWIADDRGRHYLGDMRSWSDGDELSSGVIRFPAIDARARELRVMPTGMQSRAVVAVDLS